MIEKVLDNRYELVEFVGKGGMALVYKALDRRTNHYVAVKILRPEFNDDAEFLSRFEREAIAASKMSHHNIVNLLDVGLDGGCRYLVMEYVQGRTLKEVIQEKGALPQNVAAQIAIRILSALQHAHKNGIIHRDIKPQNILVHSDGLIKVADFGIARVAGSSTISKADSVMGSVHYFSPEQARGEDVTFASDIYSVGVVMYEMMTGYVPFDGETPVAVALQHISAKPRPMSELKEGISPAMERIVLKALEKQPENRYQSALDMAQDLHRAMHEPEGDWLNRLHDKPIPSISQVPEKPPVDPKKRRTRLLLRIAAAVAVVGILFYGAFGIHTIYNQVVNATAAPYVMDETEESALRLIARAGLTPKITRTSDATHAAGTVILQSPDYDTSMKKGETIFITISTGPEEQAVPSLADKSVEDARTELSKYGFTLLVLPDRVLSDKPWDTVLEQSPPAGEMLKAGGIVQVRLSGGRVTLPNVVGETLDDALLLMQQLRLNVTEIREIPVKDDTQFGRVAAQQFMSADGVLYGVGDSVIEDTAVTLAVYVADQALSEATASPAPVQEGTVSP